MVVRRALPALFLVVGLIAQQPRLASPSAPSPEAVEPAPLVTDPARRPLSPSEARAREILATLDLRGRIAQLVIGVANGDTYSTESEEYERFRHWVADLHLGGIIVNNAVEFGAVRNANPHTMAVFLNQMQRLADVPLLIASDFERAASMRVTGGTQFPHSMAFAAANDLSATRFEGLTAAREARAIGVHWIFAPVSDVNNNPENPIINLRSYGEDPEDVARHVRSFIEGAHAEPANRVLVTAKHFPGHGDTDVDSHLGLPLLDIPRERFEAIELKPFRAAIAANVDSIMTAHIAVPQLDPSGVPSTVSPAVLTSLLRDELHFDNLIVTDAMNMAGLSRMFDSAEGSVRSLEAGADVLLMPSDPEAAIEAVATAVETGRLTPERIDQSAMRVLTSKVRLGLLENRLVDLEKISEVLDSKVAAERAQDVADRAVTLLRNQRDLLPLRRNDRNCLVVVNSLRISHQGLQLAQDFREHTRRARVATVDTSMPLSAIEAITGNPRSCSVVVVAAFTSVSNNLRSVAAYLRRLTDGQTPIVLVALNNPYLLADFPGVDAYLTTFSSARPSETAAVKALFGDILITGHSPVTIPDFAEVGDGIHLDARSR